jgi:hypothetical protein
MSTEVGLAVWRLIEGSDRTVKDVAFFEVVCNLSITEHWMAIVPGELKVWLTFCPVAPKPSPKVHE